VAIVVAQWRNHIAPARGQWVQQSGGAIWPTVVRARDTCGHLWIEVDDDIVDFSSGHWIAEAQMLYETTTDPADRRLGPVEWSVAPPEFNPHIRSRHRGVHVVNLRLTRCGRPLEVWLLTELRRFGPADRRNGTVDPTNSSRTRDCGSAWMRCSTSDTD
jgi:hypothetical protein